VDDCSDPTLGLFWDLDGLPSVCLPSLRAEGVDVAKVVVYTKSNCPYCVRAKDLLTRKGVDFEEIYLDDRPEEYVSLKQRTGMMTVPQIFINDQLVGGYTDLAALDQAQKLDEMLK
jgi:glutaredoxin 3